MTDEINITPEETAKIAGILETKWTQTYADMTKWKAEAESKSTELDVMTADRNYWRKRAEDLVKMRAIVLSAMGVTARTVLGAETVEAMIGRTGSKSE